MTNTEAIKILNKCRDRGFERTTYTIEEYHTARDMAIKALEQEPKDDKCYYCEHNFTPYKGNTGEFIEQEPTSVKHDTFPVKLQINKVSKHISNIDLDEFEQEPKYCDRNICLKNEYNGIGCDECEVTKSQEPHEELEQAQTDGEYISKDTAIDDITTGLCDEIACSECPFDKPDIICKVQKWLRELPSVAIPSAEPREVLYTGDGYSDGEMVYDMAECMNCGREFEYGDETWGCKFCPDCGQALMWEGEEE